MKIINILYEIKNDQKRFTNYARLNDLFSDNMSESNVDEDKRSYVLSDIKNNSFEKNNPIIFKKALDKSKHKQMLTDYSIDELKKMKLFKLKNYDIGYALKKSHTGNYDEIVSVFNNEDGVKNIGMDLIMSAVKNGGCFLDHFDGFLSNLYSNAGFVEYKRDPYDPQYDIDGSFKLKYGEAPVIYRIHKTCLNDFNN